MLSAPRAWSKRPGPFFWADDVGKRLTKQVQRFLEHLPYAPRQWESDERPSERELESHRCAWRSDWRCKRRGWLRQRRTLEFGSEPLLDGTHPRIAEKSRDQQAGHDPHRGRVGICLRDTMSNLILTNI